MKTIEDKLKAKVLKKYPKGTRFISPIFPSQICKSTGDIAGIGFDENFTGWANVWVDDGMQLQDNVPVLYNGQWAEIIKSIKL